MQHPTEPWQRPGDTAQRLVSTVQRPRERVPRSSEAWPRPDETARRPPSTLRCETGPLQVQLQSPPFFSHPWQTHLVVALRVIEPCEASWDAMTTTPHGRYCDKCGKDVHDLRGLGEREAAGYVRLRGGSSLCVRILVVGAAVAACGRPVQSAPRPAAPPAAPLGTELAGPQDIDHDDIPAADDKCPEEPEDKDGIDDSDGCPEKDADSDGIADEQDACPKEPGTASADPKKNGCPQLVAIETMGATVVMQAIHFLRGNAKVLRESFPLVDEVVAVLKQNPNVLRVEVAGFASADEPDARELSLRRANAVRQRMVSAGIDDKRLVARGYGATLPVADDHTSQGREANRRVEYRILEEAPQAQAQSCLSPPSPAKP